MARSVTPHFAQVQRPPWPELEAAPHWRCVDFISDLHLQAGEPGNFHAWQHYMENTVADAVLILGDLFEVWVGDDLIDPSGVGTADSFETRCLRVLQHTASRCQVYFMHGNRDFLLGDTFARASGMHLLQDPAILVFAGRRWLLSHGDALCLDDTAYMQFRAQVRSANWQRDFLAQPLAQRTSAARAMRVRSEARKQVAGPWVDVDAAAALAWLEAARAPVLVHGHTHRAADHELGPQHQRWVLSDWDSLAQPPRAEVLRLQTAGPHTPLRVQRLPAGLAGVQGPVC